MSPQDSTVFTVLSIIKNIIFTYAPILRAISSEFLYHLSKNKAPDYHMTLYTTIDREN
jgi:hypothetical protein